MKVEVSLAYLKAIRFQLNGIVSNSYPLCYREGDDGEELIDPVLSRVRADVMDVRDCVQDLIETASPEDK